MFICVWSRLLGVRDLRLRWRDRKRPPCDVVLCGRRSSVTVTTEAFWVRNVCFDHLDYYAPEPDGPTVVVVPHAWEAEEVDGGHLGTDEFWVCRGCGASGGVVYDGFRGRKTTPRPFLAGFGRSEGALPDDCAEAREVIARLRAGGAP